MVASALGHRGRGVNEQRGAGRIGPHSGTAERRGVRVDQPVARDVPNISSRVTGSRLREAMIDWIWSKSDRTVG